ncbi:MAG: hypothetical protein ACRDNF_03200 [Streptosporangiaceae bacterium]
MGADRGAGLPGGARHCREHADWSNPHGGPDGGPGLHHVDLWIGGMDADEFDVIDCEDALTQGKPNGAPLLTPVEVNPPRTCR